MKKLIIIVAVALLSGCANSVKIAEPTTVRPATQQTAVEPTGGIFNTASYRPMFEDRRARFVGDTIVIAINEKTSASNKTSNNNSRTASTSFGISAFGTTPAATLAKGNLGANGTSKAEDKDEAKNDNAFSGTIVATVTEVLPNGNLLVSGEKQIGLNQGSEFIRFSGVVNPSTITTANTVSSSHVADARMEYRANGYIDEAQTMGWLARFFLNVLPF